MLDFATMKRQRKKKYPPMPTSMEIQDRQLADSLMRDPQKPLRALAKAQGMRTDEAERRLSNPIVCDYMAVRLAKIGLKLEDALKAIKDALSAEGEDGPDHVVRLKAAEIAIRLHGFLAGQDRGAAPQTSITQIVLAIREERARRGLDKPLPPITIATQAGGHAQ